MSPETATFFGQWILPIGGLICLGILFFPKLRAHMQKKKEEKEGCNHRGAPMKFFKDVPCVASSCHTVVALTLCQACHKAEPFDNNLSLVDPKWIQDLRNELRLFGFELVYTTPEVSKPA